MFDEAGKQKVRTQFRRLGWMMRIAAALGRSARMSPAESADVVIEMDAVNGELGPDFAALDCPTVFVVGTGAHSGATEDEMRTVRAAAADAEESNERVSVFATTPHKHTQILNKAPDTVVAAIEDVVVTTSLPERRLERERPAVAGLSYIAVKLRLRGDRGGLRDPERLPRERLLRRRPRSRGSRWSRRASIDVTLDVLDGIGLQRQVAPSHPRGVELQAPDAGGRASFLISLSPRERRPADP